MKTAKIIAGLGVLAMGVALVYGFTAGDFASDGARLLQNPWGIVSMVDLYTGFTLFSAWIVYRETSILRAIVWVLAVMTLGFFAASIYALITAYTSQGDWHRFWMGPRADG